MNNLIFFGIMAILVAFVALTIFIFTKEEQKSTAKKLAAFRKS